MSEDTRREAWVRIRSEDEVIRERAASGTPPRRGYGFGGAFSPAMGRLLAAHPRIGPAFGRLYAEIMLAPEGALDRRERELVAAVAAAAQDCHY